MHNKSRNKQRQNKKSQQVPPPLPKLTNNQSAAKQKTRRKTLEDLIVVTYDNEYMAQETINTLRSLNDNWMVNLYDAVAVTRDVNGKLTVQDSYQLTSKEGAGWGILWGTLIGGLVFAPFTG